MHPISMIAAAFLRPILHTDKGYNSAPSLRRLVPFSKVSHRFLIPQSPLPKPGFRQDMPTTAGAADALVVAELAAANPGRLIAIVTAEAGDAQRLLDEIPWFAPNLRVRLLPDWETLPYDNFSPHQDLVSERLATLWSAMRGELDILLVPASTAVYRLPPPSTL